MYIYIEWNENSNVTEIKTTTKQSEKKHTHTHRIHTQTNDNIVWIWKRTTKKADLLPSQFRCIASTEWYARNLLLLLYCAPNNWRMLWKDTLNNNTHQKKTNWNALSRVLFSVLGFSFCVNLLRCGVFCCCRGFFSRRLFFLLLFTHSLTACVWLLLNA